MNILILDFLPMVFCGLVVVYFAFQMVRWAERGRLRCIVYGLIACLGVWALSVAQIQAQALQEHDQAVALSADCTTDQECEQLEPAQSESEAEE